MLSKLGVAAVAMTLMASAPGLSPSAVAGGADHASTVGITFKVNLLDNTIRRCSLELPRGSDGVDVLQAAVDQGCINSYLMSGSRYPPPGSLFGRPPSPKGHHWLRCLDGICDAEIVRTGVIPATMWRVIWSGDWRPYVNRGLERYSASPGDVIACELSAYN